MRAGGLTFAPEAGTQRLRDVVNKNVTDRQLDDTTERVFSRGWTKMKLYFMIGLPTEEDDDVRGIMRCGARAARIGRQAAGRRIDVIVSVSTHVPKPHTPFQWAAMDSLSEVNRKQQLLADERRAHPQVKLRTHSAEGSMLEGVLARGDRALADVVEHAWRAGARFDSWDERLHMELWEAAFDHFGIEPRVYLESLPLEARLSWSHIDMGLDERFLQREHRRALAGRPSPPCCKPLEASAEGQGREDGGGGPGKLVCYHCGADCDLPALQQQRQAFLDRFTTKDGGKSPTRVDERPPRGTLEGSSTDGSGRPPEPNRGHRYRFRFEKTGPVALLGHLDLVRELPRVFRRLGVALIYTRGFHPKPRMTFGPALALGVASLGEQVDLRLERHFDEAGVRRLVEDMNGASAAGLRFVAAQALGPEDPAVTREIDGARYLLAFELAAVEAAAGAVDEGAEQWLAGRCEAVLAASELPIRRKVKGRQRTIDARRHIRALVPAGDGAAEVLRRAQISGDRLGVLAVVDITATGSVRVSELVQLLFDGSEAPPYCAVRVALLVRGDDRRAGLLA